MIQIDGDRLNATLQELAAIGATPGGGVTRLTLSDEDKTARDLLAKWMAEAGLEVRVDDLGNMSGIRPGTEDAPPVYMGSHIDTVVRGGRYDGALGVMGALEVIRTLNDHKVQTRLPVGIVNWTNEEGVRFEPATLASGVVAGAFTREYAYERRDRNGLVFGDELERIGFKGDESKRPLPASAYLELHIEQGPVLESLGKPVGVVGGIVGIIWNEVVVTGQSDHAGPSPMPLRKDALMAAATMIASIEKLALDRDDVAVATVGRIEVEPDTINTIPGKAVFSVDFRHPDGETIDYLSRELNHLGETVARNRGVEDYGRADLDERSDTIRSGGGRIDSERVPAARSAIRGALVGRGARRQAYGGPDTLGNDLRTQPGRGESRGDRAFDAGGYHGWGECVAAGGVAVGGVMRISRAFLRQGDREGWGSPSWAPPFGRTNPYAGVAMPSKRSSIPAGASGPETIELVITKRLPDAAKNAMPCGKKSPSTTGVAVPSASMRKTLPGAGISPLKSAVSWLT